ncbi:MAG: hypothetical protein ACRDRK_00740 [Pseudonocardia sp.]
MAHSRNNGRRSGFRTSRRSGTVEIFTAPERHWFWRILGALVRFRAELALTVFTVVVLVHFRALYTPDPPITDPVGIDPAGVPAEPPELFLGFDSGSWAELTMVTFVAVVLIIPVSRRFTLHRAMCVLTRHRVRACFVKTRTMTHYGRTPYLVWARPSAVGERLRVWLPAGLSVKDLERITQELATACWARESRITPIRSQAALVIVDIVRRDPLSASEPFTPSLVDDIEPTRPGHLDDDGIVVPLPARSTVTPPATPASPDPAIGRPERKTRTAGRNGSTPAPAAEHGPDPVPGYGGVDISDYV